MPLFSLKACSTHTPAFLISYLIDFSRICRQNPGSPVICLQLNLWMLLCLASKRGGKKVEREIETEIEEETDLQGKGRRHRVKAS